MDYDANRALELLRIGSGISDAAFREGQEDAIRHVVEGRGNLLVVQKTGWGKSFVYFIATKMLRENGAGPALLISPLIGLMRNQTAAARRMGVRAETIHSDNQSEWDAITRQFTNNNLDVLLISPERLANDDFNNKVLMPVSSRVAMLIIDEAHCISDWGHDFRPDYRRIEQLLPNLGNVRLLGTTATANNRVLQDLQQVLGPDPTIMRGELSRPSLLLQTIALPRQSERLAWLAERLDEIPGSGIIYTLTRRDAIITSDWLRERGFNAPAYMGGGNTLEERAAKEQMEDDLLANRVKALVATTALGMGFDKPDLAFVIHYQRPQSVVHYYQQVGRAGRGIAGAYGTLLSGAEDSEVTDFFIDNAFPSRDEVNQVLHALDQAPQGLGIVALQGEVNMRKKRTQQTLKLLELEHPAPVVRQNRKYQLTTARLNQAFWERTRRLTEIRHREQAEMVEYAALDSGHMEFLIHALDGNPEAAPQPDLPPLAAGVAATTVHEAVQFLRNRNIHIPPRKQWSDGKRIAPDRQTEPGRSLCYWSDAGWGHLVRAGKYEDNHFSDELVTASRDLIRNWRPDPKPAWVTCIPSLRLPHLVPDFAERLAHALNLPFQPSLVKSADRPEQKYQANSAHQERNVANSLQLTREQPRRAPVLLVDDMVDSRWTFTVAAELLRERGCPAVIPFALANTGSE